MGVVAGAGGIHDLALMEDDHRPRINAERAEARGRVSAKLRDLRVKGHIARRFSIIVTRSSPAPSEEDVAGS